MSGIARKQIEKRLAPLRELEPSLAMPPRGWIRAIREALGMTATQLATRLGVVQSRITALEKGEINRTLTLQSLRDAAEALDCHVVYALVPNKPMDALLKERARLHANEELKRLHHTMSLEDQAMDSDDFEAERARLIEELISEHGRRLWNEP